VWLAEELKNDDTMIHTGIENVFTTITKPTKNNVTIVQIGIKNMFTPRTKPTSTEQQQSKSHHNGIYTFP
jgi:hypothetical protein